jgi:putative ubiquitin-RnfH superfamily antitoxin RatB of RatAB toxin-antitoxin module
MRVEVVYALPLKQDVISLELPAGATVQQALAASGVLAAHPELDLRALQVGVWGRPRRLDAPLEDGDRVEVYRPLQIDPKEIRRRRAARRRAARDS